jgi:hypothetical protein
MPNPLLTLGSFSFIGLEVPERILVRAKQRLSVHHLGSGVSITDSLGEDCETISFGGIFTGTNASERIRLIEYMRLQGNPVPMVWCSKAVYVIIEEFELSYSSDQWIGYKVSCRSVCSNNLAAIITSDIMSVSPDIQVSDILDLLHGSGINPRPDQAEALAELAALDYDVAPSDATQQVQSLLEMIENQLSELNLGTWNGGQDTSVSSLTPNCELAEIAADAGQQAALVLALNRTLDISVRAACVNQQ